MANFESVLAGIPGLAGYEAARQQNAQQDMQSLQQATGLMGLLQAMQAQQEKQKAVAQSDALKAKIAALGPNPKEEDVLKITLQSGLVPPKDLLSTLETAATRRAQTAATLEAARSRIAETARANDSLIAHRIATEQNANVRAQLEEQRLRQQAWYNEQIVRQGGEKIFYDTGTRLNIPPAPTPPPTQGYNVTGSLPSGNSVNLQGVSFGGLQSAFNDPNTPDDIKEQLRGIPGVVQAAQAPTTASVPQATAPTYADANNLDARDLRARAAPTQQPQSSGLPPMPPEIASAPPRVQNQWRLQQTKLSIAGGGTLEPKTLEFVAKQYLAGDRQAVQGFARNATARIALQNAIVEETMKRRMTPEQTAAQIADFAGTLAASRAVGQRAANISLAATEAEEMLKIVKETSDNFARTNFVPWNIALRAYESGTGSPEIAQFGAAVNALVNVYARAINPTGQPTVSDKEHARAVLNTVQSPQQVDAVLGIISRELAIAKKAPGQVQESTRQRVTGAASKSTIDAILEKYK